MIRLFACALFLTLEAALAACQTPVAQSDRGETIYKVGENGVQPPRALNNVEAEFSPEARAKQVNGRCSVSMIVDTNGLPRDVEVVHCTDPEFLKSTTDAVEKYRFKPATTPDGRPVPVMIIVEVKYLLDSGRDPQLLVYSQMRTPPGTLSSAPDANGVYPLTQGVSAPRLVKFSDQGYLDSAFRTEGNSPCDVLLTINAKGKPSDPEVIHCEKPNLDKLATASLIKSGFEPGRFNGSPVPVRVLVHLEFAGVGPTK